MRSSGARALIEARVDGLCRAVCSDPPPAPFLFLPEDGVVLELAPGGRREKCVAAERWLVLACWAEGLLPPARAARALFASLGRAELRVVGDAISELHNVGSGMVRALIDNFAADALDMNCGCGEQSWLQSVTARLASCAPDAYCVVLPTPTRESLHDDSWIVCTKVRGEVAELRRVEPVCCHDLLQQCCCSSTPGATVLH